MKQGPTLEQTTPQKHSARYVVEIRNAAGASLFLTTADWTDSERDATMASILRLLGHKPAEAKPRTRQSRAGEALRARKSTTE